MAYEPENWRQTRGTDLAVVQSFGAFSPGGRFLASADTNTIEVRETRGGGIIATMEMGGVTSLAISADGGLLVAADDEGTISAWSLPPAALLWRARLTMPPPAFAQVVYDVQFTPGGMLGVVSKPAGVNNTIVEIWPMPAAGEHRPDPVWQNVMLNSDYQAFSPSPDGLRVLLGTDEGYWVLEHDGARLFIDEYYEGGEHAVVAFSPDGTLAAGVEPEGAWVYEPREHAMREVAGMDTLDEPTDVGWSPDAAALLITSEDGLTICARGSDGFERLGMIDDSPGIEAATFLDDRSIVAKRGDTLLLFEHAG